jgi:hypothetical protein
MTDDVMPMNEEELYERRLRRRKQLAIAGTVLLVAAGVGAYFMCCPESPRFNRKPLTKEWWQRQKYHAFH